jgi:type I restriction enzyme S subunit
MENGKSAVAEKLLNGYGFGSTEYHVFRPKSVELNIKYLHALLRMKRLRFAAMNYFGGSSGHQRVDEAFFVNLHIPLPEPTVQRRIVEEIENRRTDARTLRAEAQTELEAAKRRIEAMLLGATA